MYTKAQVIYTVKMIKRMGFEMYAIIRVDGMGVKELKTCWSEANAWTLVYKLRNSQTIKRYKAA